MFDFITKSEYWSWIDHGITAADVCTLKHVQDAYVLSKLADKKGCRILEMGGGNSRVMRQLARRNECWNADKFEGVGQGPTLIERIKQVKVIKAYIGDFDQALPDNYFDFIFSISVIEHVAADFLENVFGDFSRLLKPGGQMFHAIDMYLFDAADRDFAGAVSGRARMKRYLKFSDRPDLRLRLAQPAAVDEEVSFSCKYATNSDNELYNWNKAVPQICELRARGQSVSLKAEWIKS
jgi:cyclopropane fatty-acyl-phospholipid synthase-like methyltransferase